MESFGYKDLRIKFGWRNAVQVLTGDRRQDSGNSPMDSKSRLFTKTIMSVHMQLINLNYWLSLSTTLLYYLICHLQ